MAHLIADPDRLVVDALRGLAAASPHLLRVQEDPPMVLRVDAPVADRVALVSGGGAGHEPMHSGLVGEGLLAAAVPGDVFSSPSAYAVLEAVRAVDAGPGVLLVVKNYTGDVMNFDMAGELAQAEGHDVRRVLVADDVAVDGSTATQGRRGVAGTVVVEKIAGAAAARGDDLDAVEAVAQRATEGVRSMGATLTTVTLPGAEPSPGGLGEGEMEVGIGIHGEPGRHRMAAEPADRLVSRLLDAVLDDLPDGPADVLLMTNSMGALAPLEISAAHGYAVDQLGQRGLRVVRSLVGPWVTSLDMAGLSLTVLRLDDELLSLWDAPARTVAWTQ